MKIQDAKNRQLECGPILAQRDDRPAEYRFRPLFNAAKFGWRPLLQCRAVTLPGRETRWNVLGCPKLANRSQPLVGRTSPYCGDMWKDFAAWRVFFSIVDRCLRCEAIARQSCAMVPKWRFFASCIFSDRVQRISDMHSKFALRPHHVWKYQIKSNQIYLPTQNMKEKKQTENQK